MANQLNVVTLAQAKEWLRRDDYTADDAIITSLIKAAVNQVELFTCQILWQRSISAQTGRDGKYRIFEYPLLSIESLKNNDGESQEYDESETEWYTEICSDDTNCIQTLVFVAGYGWTYTGGTETPDDILTAIKELIAYMYENRDNPKPGLPQFIKLLLQPRQRRPLF